jgi:hypothetical protein
MVLFFFIKMNFIAHAAAAQASEKPALEAMAIV